MKIHLHDEAWETLKNQGFLNAWDELYSQCAWATPYQSQQFVITWFENYKNNYSPVIITLSNKSNKLLGLFLLATSKQNNQIVSPGAHQAEYQCWLSAAECPVDFITNALTAIYNKLDINSSIILKYIPPELPIHDFFESTKFSGLAELKKHRRPLLHIDAANIEKSFKKKSNKSRFNRLKKLGDLEFRKLTDDEDLTCVFDKIIDFYNFRQGAFNNSFPFQEDPQKRDFHLDLFKLHKDFFHFTITSLNGEPIAAHIGVTGENIIHLAILAYSPLYAKSSPGKLHLMGLGKQLVNDDIQLLDLTPGGDAWKERFSDHSDEVHELIIYPSPRHKKIQSTKEALLQTTKKFAQYVGITPKHARTIVALLKRITIKSVLNKIHSFIPKLSEMRIYYHTVASAQKHSSPGRMKKNNITDLLKYTPIETWQNKQSFCYDALNRFEKNIHSYTLSSNNKLLHYGWLVEQQTEAFISEVQHHYKWPEHSTILYDFYTDPDARGQGLYQENVRHMLSEACASSETKNICISALASNKPSCYVIEKLGFEYIESLFLFDFFGMKFKWKNKTP